MLSMFPSPVRSFKSWTSLLLFSGSSSPAQQNNKGCHNYKELYLSRGKRKHRYINSKEEMIGTCPFSGFPPWPFVQQKRQPQMEEELMKTNVHTLSLQYLHRYLKSIEEITYRWLIKCNYWWAAYNLLIQTKRGYEAVAICKGSLRI